MVEAEVAEAEAPAPRMIIVDKRLAEALALLGANVYESTIADNMFTPEQYRDVWKYVTDEANVKDQEV